MKNTMKRLRKEHRDMYTFVKTESIPRGEDGFVEVRTRVKRPNYMPFKAWARSLKAKGELGGEFCPKLEKILAKTPQ
jgi:hypothetical protein